MFDGGRKLSVGDCALFQAGNAPPFIGILRKLPLEKDSTKLGVNWLYRPTDVKLAKGGPLEAAPNEIFYSFHKDEISAASLLHPCKVAFLRKGAELPQGVSSFVCRRVYDTANKCLWWLTDRDYTDEHQDEVDQLLERTKLEMQAAVLSGGPSPRALAGPTSSQLLKSGSEVVQNAAFSAPNKTKKRERTDQSLEPSKRERSVKCEDGELSPLKRDRSMKPDEIASITDKDGGLLNPACVERLVVLMQQDRNDCLRKASDVASRRTMLACVIAATERDDCLNRFVQLGGLPMLDDWLQEAHKGKVGEGGSPKEGDKGVEELLLTLLKALDKLPVDLDALKTCSVGKSVNHLRSHKNLEIQKKARKLVDIWKKRVDAEMKLSGEVKSPSNHGIWSSSYKQNSPDMMHSHLMKSGGPTEVAVKSSGAFAGSAKPMPNGANGVEGISKLGPLPAGGGKMSSMLASAASPPVKREENGNMKLSSETIPSDFPVSVKEEKSMSALQAHSNGQAWGSQPGKSVGSTNWKEDVKNASMGGAISSKPMGPGCRHPSLSGKGLLGTSLTNGPKEVLSGKPLVWNRPTSTDKLNGSPSISAEKGAGGDANPQHRLIVRIPNSGRSPARMTGGFEQTTPGSRGLSPNLAERCPSMNFDTSDGKGRPQFGNSASTSPVAGSENKAAGFARQLPGADEEGNKCSSSVQSDNLTDGDKRGEEPPRVEPDRSVKSFNEHNVGGGFLQRSGEGAMEVDDTKKAEVCTGSTRVPPEVGTEVTAMDADDLGMSLLASVAASEIRRAGANGTAHDRNNAEDACVDQDRGSRGSSDVTFSHPKASESQHIVKENCDGNDQMETEAKQDGDGCNSTNGEEDGTAAQVGEGHSGMVVDVATKDPSQENLSPRLESESRDGERRLLTSQESGRLLEKSTGSGVVKVSQDRKRDDRRMEDTEMEAALLSTGSNLSLEGHMSKSSKKSALEEKNMQGKGTEMYGSNSNEMRSYQGVGRTDSESKPEDPKAGNEAVQSFGRRGMDSDGLKMSDMAKAFPQEDVLEVARQVEKEVEQMERFGKSAAMSTEKPGQELKSPGFKANEMREANYSDAGRDHRWTPHIADNAADDDSWKRNVYGGDRVEVPDRLEQSKVNRPTEPGEAEADLPRGSSSSVERRAPVFSEAMGAALEVTQDLKRRAMNMPGLGRLPSFQSMQMMGLPNLAPVTQVPMTVQHVVKPAPRPLLAGEPTTPEQATETAGPSDGVAGGGSDASERPDFDLNEGFSVEESPHDDSSTSPVAPVSLPLAPTAAIVTAAAPIAIVTATKGGFVFPASPMRSKSELGWKGSAATSAFRPAEPRRTPERQPSAGDNMALEVSSASTSRKGRPPLDLNIDLNVVDDRSFEENGMAQTGGASSFSSQGSAAGLNFGPPPSVSMSGLAFQSDHSSGGQPHAQRSVLSAARPILDLNMLDESEESGTLLNMDVRVTQAVVPSARSINSSSSQPIRQASVVRDFDLNDLGEDGAPDEQPAMPLMPPTHIIPPVVVSNIAGPVMRRGLEVANRSWYAANNQFKAVPDFSTRAESPYSVAAAAPYSVAAAAAAQSYLSAGGGVPFNPEMYRSNVTLSSAPTMTFSTSGPPGPYPYSGFPLASGFPFASGFTSNTGSTYHDSNGSVPFPVSSTGAAVNHFGRPPYMMGLSEVGSSESGNGGWLGRPSLDLNAGPDAGDGDGGKQEMMSHNLRQMSMMGAQPSLDQMRGVFRQVVVNPGGPTGPVGPPPLKRKEPENGWDMNSRTNGFKQQAWQ